MKRVKHPTVDQNGGQKKSLWKEQSNSWRPKGERQLPGAEVRGNGELLFKGYRVSVLPDGRVLRVDGGNGCTAVRMYLMSLNTY